MRFDDAQVSFMPGHHLPGLDEDVRIHLRGQSDPVYTATVAT